MVYIITLCLCIHSTLPPSTLPPYSSFLDNSTDRVYIMLEARLEALFHSPSEYEILGSMAGAALVGKKYKPLFDYFAYLKSEEAGKGAFQVVRCSIYSFSLPY